MSAGMDRRHRRLWALAGFSLATGCVSATQDYRRVEISGVVSVDDDAPGPVTVEVHHAWVGEGALRYPMDFIAAFSQDGPGAYQLTVDVPTDPGAEGLALYAWQDRDGDGVLCGLDGAVEPAGVAEAEGWPAYALTVDIDLDTDCAGPEALYP